MFIPFDIVLPFRLLSSRSGAILYLSIVQDILVAFKNLNSNKSSNTFHMLSLEISCSKRFSQLMEKSMLPVIAFRVG